MITSSGTKTNQHGSATGGQITLAHGGGGQLTDELLAEAIQPRLSNAVLDQLMDSAVLGACTDERLALTIDSYVVKPWRFPGGDIGRLAVCGTVNDLAMTGARPLGLALSLILTEGLPRADLDTVLDSIAAVAAEAKVHVVTGDTKVVARGEADGIYITTAGVGTVPRERSLSCSRVEPGDVLLINGPIGDHGMAVMLAREMPTVQSAISSDTAPLNGLAERLLVELGPAVKFMRDATRGGLSGVAAELAARSGWHVRLDEPQIPLRPEVWHAAEMLGLDPLDVANEGKVVIVVREAAAERALEVMHSHVLGQDGAIIGRIESVADGLCELCTSIGGRRIVQKPYGEMLARIC